MNKSKDHDKDKRWYKEKPNEKILLIICTQEIIKKGVSVT